jgi:hypothetical protein
MFTFGLKPFIYWFITFLFNILIISIPILLEFVWIVSEDSTSTPSPSVTIVTMGNSLYNIFAFSIPFTSLCCFYTIFFDYSFVCFSFITAVIMFQNALSDIIAKYYADIINGNNNPPYLFYII